MIVDKYKELYEPVQKVVFSVNCKIGFAFGLSQFTQFGAFAAMFYALGHLMDAHWSMSMDDGMRSLFAIMFAAFQAGNAAAFGPDIGKATAAANRVF